MGRGPPVGGPFSRLGARSDLRLSQDLCYDCIMETFEVEVAGSLARDAFTPEGVSRMIEWHLEKLDSGLPQAALDACDEMGMRLAWISLDHAGRVESMIFVMVIDQDCDPENTLGVTLFYA
jgi:hypothetical protein